VSFIRPDLLSLQPYDAVVPQTADKLDANEYPVDLPEWFKKKLSLLWEKGIASNRYPEASHASLKQAIAQYAGVAADQISLGNGSDELIRSLLLISCLGERGAILVAEPTFSMYAILARSLGIPVIRTQRHVATMALDLQACTEAMAKQLIRVVCLVSPNSPTGNAVTPAEWDWIRSLPEDVLVMIDEAYFEFSGETMVPQLQAHPNWVILRTFSKAFRLAAHRVGYALAAPPVIQVLEATRLPYNLPMFSQWAVQLALEHADELLSDIPQIRLERDHMYTTLQRFPNIKVWPSVANFLFMHLDGTDPAQLQQQWLNKGTCARCTGGGLRLTIGTPEENRRSLRNLEQLLHPTASLC
jgi:histidinol-phosphate aminotransferase